MDAVYAETTQAVELPPWHPCATCESVMADPEGCRGCSDFDMNPSLHPLPEELPRPDPEPAYRSLFKALIQ